MDEQAAGALQRHVAQCRNCEDAFLTIVRDRELIRSRKAPVPSELSNTLPVRQRSRRRRLPGIAAGVALAAVLALTLQLTSTSSAPDYWISQNYFEGKHQRNGHDSEARQAMLNAYRQHNAKEVLRNYSKLKASPARPEVFLIPTILAASAELNAGRPERALDYIHSLDRQFIPMPWKEEALWIQYLGHSRLDQDKDACRALERVVDEGGGKAEAAQAMLNQNCAPE